MKIKFDVGPRYFLNRYGEIDYLIQKGNDIIPVEVKAGTEKSAATFKKYIAEKQPKCAIRFSEMNYVRNGMITNIPLYLGHEWDVAVSPEKPEKGNYMIMTADKDKLVFKAFLLNGKQFDEVIIKK